MASTAVPSVFGRTMNIAHDLISWYNCTREKLKRILYVYSSIDTRSPNRELRVYFLNLPRSNRTHLLRLVSLERSIIGLCTHPFSVLVHVLACSHHIIGCDGTFLPGLFS